MSSVPDFSNSEVVVWGPLVRAIHRSQVASFAVTYLSGEVKYWSYMPDPAIASDV